MPLLDNSNSVDLTCAKQLKPFVQLREYIAEAYSIIIILYSSSKDIPGSQSLVASFYGCKASLNYKLLCVYQTIYSDIMASVLEVLH